jgi:radical SAM protein with 4Fe4S-binding SPASM domain
MFRKIIHKLLRKEYSVRTLFQEGLRKLFIEKRSITNPFPPFSLEIQVTNLCNFNCRMCGLKYFSPQHYKHMSLNTFKKVLDNFSSRTTPWVNFTGGEPLLNSDFFQILSYTKRKNFKTSFFTNCSLIGKIELEKLRGIIQNANIINISVDGITKEIYETIRENGNFETLIKNIKKLVGLKNVYSPKTQIGISFTASSINFHQLLDLPLFAKEMGIDRILIQQVRIPTIIDEEKYKNLSNIYKALRIDSEEFNKKIKIVELLCRKLKLTLNWNPLFKPKDCLWPWKTIFVQYDGSVLPCCQFIEIENKTCIMGNLLNQSFSQIWNNEKYQKLRKTLISNRIPEICKHCGEM